MWHHRLLKFSRHLVCLHQLCSALLCSALVLSCLVPVGMLFMQMEIHVVFFIFLSSPSALSNYLSKENYLKSQMNFYLLFLSKNTIRVDIIIISWLSAPSYWCNVISGNYLTGKTTYSCNTLNKKNKKKNLTKIYTIKQQKQYFNQIL